MRIQDITLIIILVLLILMPSSLTSASLDEIIKTAKENSEEIKRYELDRKNTALSVSMSEAEDDLGITVSTGEVRTTLDFDKGNHSLSTTGTGATFTLPNDGKTTVMVSSGKLSYNTNSKHYAINPSVGASHSFIYGESSDNRSSLLNRQSSLLGIYTYESSLIQFENSILNQIKALLTNEKSINETLKTIVIQHKGMSDALALQTLTKDSVAYKELENSMTRLQDTLASLITNQELLESQYRELTSLSWNSQVRLGAALAMLQNKDPSKLNSALLIDSLSWEGIPPMREPNLAFEKNPNGNTTVALKGLALELAQEDLKLARGDLTKKSLKVEGGANFSSTRYEKVLTPGPPPTYTDATTQTLGGIVGATFSAKTYSFGGSVQGTYDLDSNMITPTLTVQGSWNNNPTQLTEKLNIQKLENSVALASIAYNDALQEYLYSASSLQGQIASWQLKYALLERTISYNRRALEQQEALFEKGLTTQSNLDNAKFAVGQDTYERAFTLIEGLVLENSIRNLQIQGR